VAKASPANEAGGFHEGVGGVTQEDPADGVEWMGALRQVLVNVVLVLAGADDL